MVAISIFIDFKSINFQNNVVCNSIISISDTTEDRVYAFNTSFDYFPFFFFEINQAILKIRKTTA